MRFAFIAKRRHVWPVSWLCAAMGVSRSGFHAWLKPANQRADGARREDGRGDAQKLQGQRPYLRRPADLA